MIFRIAVDTPNIVDLWEMTGQHAVLAHLRRSRSTGSAHADHQRRVPDLWLLGTLPQPRQGPPQSRSSPPRLRSRLRPDGSPGALGIVRPVRPAGVSPSSRHQARRVLWESRSTDRAGFLTSACSSPFALSELPRAGTITPRLVDPVLTFALDHLELRRSRPGASFAH